ncbi:TIGR03619 family F420-dependent LLM class oxidoreductase [Streptosporangium sp. 'caverna']|uniref:TIGR03619 family F420-dependent LLM class oxidoreductase n=1 Tax=Streptosporangium sp. 'caverna' TaxID=2202249 RepID=UPI000D7E9BB5|nr:TIGR03619 family F420-dependent LLM class oxidoreductase [Streptosporangium sp. 'caverna']AWS48975.1 LLM class F420-dependent oxidoreductase [Streptosporangium sp. 'caverna']
MRIGFTLPQLGALAHYPREVTRFARQAEQLGADSLWVGDRLLAPVNPTVGYGSDGTIPRAFHARLDPFVLLSIAAVSTEHVQIGTNVLNAPWYPPAVLARSLTSIDLVSGGRLIPGLGVGWSPEEYLAVGVPMAQRGARLDECLDALEAYWSDNPVEYHGAYWTIPATYTDLKPAQHPRPPIYLGGYSPAAMRRAARRADGWLPVVRPGSAAWEFSPAAVNDPVDRLRNMATEQGRDPSQLDLILRVYPTAEGTVDQVVDAITGAEQHTPVEHAFVDLMEIAEDVDHALEIVNQVLERSRNT